MIGYKYFHELQTGAPYGSKPSIGNSKSPRKLKRTRMSGLLRDEYMETTGNRQYAGFCTGIPFDAKESAAAEGGNTSSPFK